MRLVLLMFALVGFIAGGAALAVARYRLVGDGEQDAGLIAISGMFLLFGTLCTLAASGIFGVLAFGGVAVWASYVVMAQRLGLFSVETSPDRLTELEPSELDARRR